MTTRVGSIKVDFDGDARGLEATHRKVVALQDRTVRSAGKMGEALKKASYGGSAASEKLAAATKKTADSAGQATSRLQQFAEKADKAASPQLEKGVRALGGAFGSLGGQASGAVGAIGDVMGMITSGMGAVGAIGGLAAAAAAGVNMYIEASEKAAKREEDAWDRANAPHREALKLMNDRRIAATMTAGDLLAQIGLSAEAGERRVLERRHAEEMGRLTAQRLALESELDAVQKSETRNFDSIMARLEKITLLEQRIVKAKNDERIAGRGQDRELEVLDLTAARSRDLADQAEREARARERSAEAAARQLDAMVRQAILKADRVNTSWEDEVWADLDANPPTGPVIDDGLGFGSGMSLVGPFTGSLRGPSQASSADQGFLQREAERAEIARDRMSQMQDDAAMFAIQAAGSLLRGDLTGFGSQVGSVMGAAAAGPIGSMVGGAVGELLGALPIAMMEAIQTVLASVDKRLEPLWTAAGGMGGASGVQGAIGMPIFLAQLTLETKSYAEVQAAAGRSIGRVVRELEPFFHSLRGASALLDVAMEGVGSLGGQLAQSEALQRVAFDAAKEFTKQLLHSAVMLGHFANFLSDIGLIDVRVDIEPIVDAYNELQTLDFEKAQRQADKERAKAAMKEAALARALDRNTDALKARELTNVPSGYRVPLYDSERPDGGGAGGVPIMPPQRTGEANVFQGPVTFVMQGADVAQAIREQAIRQRGAPTAAPRRRAPTPGN
jgi:hypothetical protein